MAEDPKKWQSTMIMTIRGRVAALPKWILVFKYKYLLLLSLDEELHCCVAECKAQEGICSKMTDIVVASTAENEGGLVTNVSVASKFGMLEDNGNDHNKNSS
jgi:hypothetical protein